MGTPLQIIHIDQFRCTWPNNIIKHLLGVSNVWDIKSHGHNLLVFSWILNAIGSQNTKVKMHHFYLTLFSCLLQTIKLYLRIWAYLLTNFTSYFNCQLIIVTECIPWTEDYFIVNWSDNCDNNNLWWRCWYSTLFYHAEIIRLQLYRFSYLSNGMV